MSKGSEFGGLRRHRSRKRLALGKGWVIAFVVRRPEPFPVETADLLKTRHQPGDIHSKPVQRHDGDAIAHELQILETAAVSELEGTFAFGPNVFMRDFVGEQGLEVVRIE